MGLLQNKNKLNKFLIIQAILVFSGFLYNLYILLIANNSYTFIIPFLTYICLIIYTVKGYKNDDYTFFKISVILLIINGILNAIFMVLLSGTSELVNVVIIILSLLISALMISFMINFNNYRKAMYSATLAVFVELLSFIPLAYFPFVHINFTINFIYLYLYATVTLIYALNKR